MGLILKFYNNFKKFSLTGKISFLFIILMIMTAVFAPYLSLYPPDQSSGAPLSGPGKGHILGTDELGYDIWSQISYGARISLLVGFATALLAAFTGGIIGIISAYCGGLIDKIIMRIVDIVIIMPGLPVMIVLAAFLGPSLVNIIIVLALFSWAIPARIVRSQVLMIKEMAYIKSAESYEAGLSYLLRRHFLPEVFPLLTVNIIKLSAKAIVAEAGLSFLGLGDPVSKSWGVIIHHAINFQGIYYTPFWKWWLLYPLLFLSLLIVSLAFLSRDLEEIYSLRK
ncbi:MAG: ABC transporter permease [Firmicutes bacterium]|nr:ABC transporter permease [Bacillota bacterium]